ncbi:VOC family protein [Glycomyces scopariae]|uniref:Glyoxalase superfamily enzyme, possibly 3-demethylubiquinone-9 3-methyltransferase n=1 Tax=Glycomyces sambucus TaxID=380244 RepID=A0A1G9DF61_9ACTN|nr:VOC family protein [Glycomyces sambucus]SDK62487.1 Glyoxalase superfamily enzyme, possibly 3-demethylubiquinone-9 3-methyltransferase [Glycomyces sambucus]
MREITTFLWFDGKALEAAEYYTSVFEDGRILGTVLNGSAGPGAEGTVLTVDFELAGRRYIALNGGAGDGFNTSVSLMVQCETGEEVDYYWERLSDGGEQGPCGWLKDRFGVSWQVTPTLMFELQQHPDQVKAQAVVAAMLRMGKLDPAALQAAFDAA